jgi:hypothetical protein
VELPPVSSKQTSSTHSELSHAAAKVEAKAANAAGAANLEIRIRVVLLGVVQPCWSQF